MGRCPLGKRNRNLKALMAPSLPRQASVNSIPPLAWMWKKYRFRMNNKPTFLEKTGQQEIQAGP